MFSPFVFVLFLVLGIPIAKAIAARIAKGGEAPPPEVVARLKEALDAAEQRTLDSDHRVSELEERVDFLEKLLQAPRSKPPLPPPGGPTMPV